MPDQPRDFETLLAQSQQMLATAQADATIQSALEQFGYDEARLQEGQRLYEQATSLHEEAQALAPGPDNEALRAAWTQAEPPYMRAFQVARVAFKKQPQLWHTLGIAGERKESLTGWLGQAQQFYQAALASPEVQEQLATFNLSTAQLQEGQRLVEGLADLHAQQAQAQGDAESLSRQRDEAVDALHEWSSDFRSIARLALTHEPHLLAELGIEEER